MFAFVKTPRPSVVAASPRSASYARAGATQPPTTEAPTAGADASDWEHVSADVPSTTYEPQQATRHGPVFVVSGVDEAEETLQAAYAEYVRSGASAAAACLNSLIARDRDSGRLALARAASTLSTKLLSLPSVGSASASGATLLAGGASATAILVSMLLDEKAARHQTLCAMLREAIPQLLAMPMYAKTGAEISECSMAENPAERTLADVLTANDARLAGARALRAEHNTLSTLAESSMTAGNSDASADAGARLALSELHEALTRCAGAAAAAAPGGAAPGGQGSSAVASFYRDVHCVERLLPELSHALVAVASRCAHDGSQRSASVAHALLLLLKLGAHFVGAAERAASGRSALGGSEQVRGSPTELVAAGGPFPTWLSTESARRALLHAAATVVEWLTPPSAAAFGNKEAPPPTAVAVQLLTLVHQLAATGVRGRVAEAAAAWAAADGDADARSSKAAAASEPVRAALRGLVRARREAAAAFTPLQNGSLMGSATGLCAVQLKLALSICEESHEFATLAKLSSRNDAPRIDGISDGAGEERVAYYLRAFHPQLNPRSLWRWELGAFPPADADTDGVDASEAASGGGFVHALLRFYLMAGAGMLPLLLQLPSQFDADAEAFLQAYPRLLWLHHLKVGARAAAVEGASAELGAGARPTAFEPRGPFAPPRPQDDGGLAGALLGGMEDGDGGARAFGAAAEALYGQAAAEEASLSIRSLFAHLGKLAHLASAPELGEDLSPNPGSLLGGSVPDSLSVTVASGAQSGAAVASSDWPLERADDLIYTVQAQRMLQGIGPLDEVSVLLPAELIEASLSQAPDPEENEGLSERDVLLALDLWHRSRWELADAEANDKAARVGPGGEPLRPRTGDASELGKLARARANQLEAIWVEVISVELSTVWQWMCDPAASWQGDEQLASRAQSSLLYKAVIYQHSHGRINTLASIERAVSKCLGDDQTPMSDHVRASLLERVQQVFFIYIS